MSDQIRVPLEVLRRATQVILDQMEDSGVSELTLDKDYFWSIPPDEAYDVYNEPSNLTVGQLTECLDNLKVIVEDPSRSTSFALVWLGELMRAVGHGAVR